MSVEESSTPPPPVRRFSRFEIALASASALYLAGVIVLAHLLSGELQAWLYRNPCVYLPWRFAVAFLVGLVVAAFMKNCTLRVPDLLVFLVFLLVFAVPSSFIAGIFQLMFGYGPALHYAPGQILAPILLASGLHLYLRRRVWLGGRLQRGLLGLTLFALVFLVLTVLATPVLFCRPMNYNWYHPYLSSKYGVPVKDSRTLAALKARPVSYAQTPPDGLVVNYLFFGERAVDYSALND